MEIAYKQALPYTAISDVINDAMEHRPCFVKGVEETWMFVWTSTTEELERLIGRREIRRAEEFSPAVEMNRSTLAEAING